MKEFDWFSLAQAVAAVFGVIVAILALRYAAKQIDEGKSTSRSVDARQAHRDYLHLCVDRPELSSSLMFAKKNGLVTFAGIDDNLSMESEAYLWLLSVLLNNCEQILEGLSSSGPWRKVLHNQLRIHYPAFEVLWPGWKNGYSNKLKSLMQEVLAAGPEQDWLDHVSNGIAKGESGKDMVIVNGSFADAMIEQFGDGYRITIGGPRGDRPGH
jgi:hypothetical protein